MSNVIPVGPYHPLLEEAEYFTLTVDGETVTDIDLDIDFGVRDGLNRVGTDYSILAGITYRF